MKIIIRVVWLTAMFGMPGRPASAQTLASPSPRTGLRPSVFTLGAVPLDRRGLSSTHPIPQRRRDSLWNGTLVGAGLGAIAGVLTGEAIVECSECAGFNVPLTFGVVGAGAGAAIGAGIDAALHDRSPSVQPERVRRIAIAIAPVFGRRARALIVLVRF